MRMIWINLSTAVRLCVMFFFAMFPEEEKIETSSLPVAEIEMEESGTLNNVANLNDFSIYCQSVFLDVEIYPLICLLEFEEVASVQGKFQFRIKDSTSAYLRVSGTSGVINLTLDVQTHITALPEPEEDEGNQNQNQNILRSFIFTRFGERYRINVLHYAQVIDDILENEFATFGFFLQQFCRFYDPQLIQVNSSQVDQKRQVNVVARGAESTGFLLRQGLKGGGKSAGNMIRYLGQKVPVRDDSTSSDAESTSLLQSEVESGDQRHQPQPYIPLTEEQIAAEEKRAEYIRQQAETIHSYAKTATSAIMLPIRMIGRKAVELAQPNAEEEKGWKRAVMDTVGGCGNGIMSVAKGFTEGLQEMGLAIEEVAMQRAIEKYGPEYAERVTRKYLSAGSEGCRAAIKTVSVASMGFHGFVAGMAVEGVDYAVNLKDYLVGPVILQNYLQVLQYPLTKSVRYFTVLRPWCLAFYYHHNEFATKPHKIIATSNLDTIPKLREERVRDLRSGEMITVKYIEISTLDGSTYALRLDSTASSIENLNWFNTTDLPPSEVEMDERVTGSNVILEWFRQIEDGSRRMETIRKQQSGATELREERWLKRIPRGMGWKWNGDIPEVILGDNIYNFTLYNLYLSAEQIKEAMEFEPNDLVEAELVAMDNRNVVVDAVLTPETESYPLVEDSSLEVTTPEQEAMITSFVEMIGIHRDEARQTLQRVNWDINRALDDHDLLGLSDQHTPELPSSPPEYHTVVAVSLETDPNIPVVKKITSCTPSVKSTAKAVQRNVKADISSVSVSLRIVTISGLKLKLQKTEWANLTLPSDQTLLAGRGSYRQAVWTPPVVMEIGNDMRIHRDTCTGIELIVTAHTKMGIRYKVGVSKIDMDTLTHEGGQLGSILLPIYRMRAGPHSDHSFTIGEMNLNLMKRPYGSFLKEEK